MNRCFNGSKFIIPSLFALLFVLNTVSFAQQPESYKLFLGKWTTGAKQDNAIDLGGNLIRANLVISELDGIPYARMESPDADAFNMNAEDVTIDGYKIKIYFKQIDGLYKATLGDNKNELRGTFAFTGKHISVSFYKVNAK